MNALLLHFAQWVQNASWATAIADSFWMYVLVRIIHFAGLSLWVGAIVASDLHFLGVARRDHLPGALARQLTPYAWTGFGVAVVGGFGLFSTAATTFIINPAFQLKLPLILLGVCYHIVLQRKSKAWGERSTLSGMAKFAYSIELLIWIGAIIAATTIPDV